MAKVGGLADVVRDLAGVLAARGSSVTILTPAYGVLASLPGAKHCARVEVPFAGSRPQVDIHRIRLAQAAVEHYVLDHTNFAPHRPGEIYTHDEHDGPFATDATKFAFFCASAAAALVRGALPAPDILHLHDWPAALMLFLREFAPGHDALQRPRTVLTIHNLAMQGVRPLRGHPSALESWFPEVAYERSTVIDPRWPDCVNPLAIGIRLSDAVNTVSPSYAREILEPGNVARGYLGGNGLESELGEAERSGRLSGILNGCTYPVRPPSKPSWSRLLDTMRAELAQWIAQSTQLRASHYLADKRLAKLTHQRPRVILTSIGRIVEQKVGLFREQTSSGRTALEDILEMLGSRGLIIMVGSGEAPYERFLDRVVAGHERLLFLRGYSDAVADALYGVGDLFLMPSSFEPCGISQMLAMRAGQVCVVHGVGGLRDTVTDDVDGFVFGGATPVEQASAFVARVGDALEVRSESTGRWQRMQQAAAAVRFSWDEAAAKYERVVYGFTSH